MVPLVPSYMAVLTVAAGVLLVMGVSGALLWARNRLGRSDISATRFAAVGVIVVVGWFALSLWLSLSGAYEPDEEAAFIPLIAWAISLPILVLGPFVLWSRTMGRMLDELSNPLLIGFQLYRVLGVLFLILLAQDALPAVFAVPAGIGDVLTGVLAIPVAVFLARRGRSAFGVAVGWNVFGFADLVLALTLGFLSSPGQLQMLALDEPNLIVSHFPLVLVPVFAVPVSILLHFASVRKLARDRAKQ